MTEPDDSYLTPRNLTGPLNCALPFSAWKANRVAERRAERRTEDAVFRYVANRVGITG